jgi:hypothetical protein
VSNMYVEVFLSIIVQTVIFWVMTLYSLRWILKFRRNVVPPSSHQSQYNFLAACLWNPTDSSFRVKMKNLGSITTPHLEFVESWVREMSVRIYEACFMRFNRGAK